MEKKKKPIIHINPPPQDRKCEVCGRGFKDLKPFGKAGDPLVGDFNGSILVKHFRTMAMPVTDKKFIELQKECEKKKNWDDFEEKLDQIYGKEKAKQILFTDQLACTVEASWECRDCIILDDLQYFRKLYKTTARLHDKLAETEKHIDWTRAILCIFSATPRRLLIIVRCGGSGNASLRRAGTSLSGGS